MLETLLDGQEKSRFILVMDEADCPGRHLLLNWIHSLGKRCDKVILLCCERAPEFYKNWLPPDMQNKIICLQGSSTALSSGAADSFKKLDETVSSISRAGGEAGVIIDSLTLHILLRTAPTTCQALHKLATGVGVAQLVALLHRDCHDVHTCSLVGHIASSVVDVQPMLGNKHICHIRHCRTTGKVFKTRESYRIDESFHIKDIGPVPTQPTVSPLQPKSQDDPVAELPFNLTLSESEKEARSKVRLPYLKDGSGDTDTAPAGSGGRIIYTADDADDFDEEDPDDDLNI